MDIDALKEKLFAKIPYDRLVPLNEKARWGIVLAVPVALIALIYFLLIQGTLDEANKVRDDLRAAQKEVQMKEALERRLPEFIKKIEELDSQLAMIRRQLPEKKEIPDLLDQISTMGTQSGLEFITFKPQSEVEKDFYAEVPVNLEVVGTFHSIVEFFDKVSRLPRIITISNLSISKTTRKVHMVSRLKGTPVSASCKAITFRFLESKVDAESKGQAKK
jgi:type IV pilus assembly protein PilO